VVINEGRIVFDGTVPEMAGRDHDMESRFRELTVGGPAVVREKAADVAWS
jgi:hypothetical protein